MTTAPSYYAHQHLGRATGILQRVVQPSGIAACCSGRLHVLLMIYIFFNLL